MVQIRVKGRGENVYLIFDEHEFSENLFKKAGSNIDGGRDGGRP
jgi:hypothetical protein